MKEKVVLLFTYKNVFSAQVFYLCLRKYILWKYILWKYTHVSRTRSTNERYIENPLFYSSPDQTMKI